jgi:hypothetical protein
MLFVNYLFQFLLYFEKQSQLLIKKLKNSSFYDLISENDFCTYQFVEHSFFLNGKIYYIYKRIKSQVLHQKEKINTPKTPKEKPPAPLKNQHRQQ